MEDRRKVLYRTQDAVRWLLEIAQGLQYLHEREPMVIWGGGLDPGIYRSVSVHQGEPIVRERGWVQGSIDLGKCTREN